MVFVSLRKLQLFCRLWIYVSVLLLLFSSQPLFAGTWADVEALKNELKQIGTSTVDNNCDDKETLSYYEYEESKTDRITICINNIDKDSSDEYWESLAHETAHVMQACTGDYALNDNYISRAYRELKVINPTSIDDIGLYGSWNKRQEIEARWMEFQPPSEVITLLQENCRQ
ncbi:hypothetical protein [Synechococcus sp. CBW1107]|uniref:hypothetical protein n=1 Tax=Synechococcus sp. CBW1107 TaxID=2789857 RepID=UPI002AD42102|nr:hypothetical protein [Synechococcus sp. CBW1107]